MAAATVTDQFCYKDVTHLSPPSDESLRSLRCHFLTMKVHMAEEQKLKLISVVRSELGNLPLANALAQLLLGGFVSQAHKVALEEGLFYQIQAWAREASQELKPAEIFKSIRPFIGYILEWGKQLQVSDAMRKRNSFVVMRAECHLSAQTILRPGLVELDSKDKVIVDVPAVQSHLEKGLTYDSWKKPTLAQVKESESLRVYFQIARMNA